MCQCAQKRQDVMNISVFHFFKEKTYCNKSSSVTNTTDVSRKQNLRVNDTY